jgi:serine/threonine protein kinase
MIDRISSHPSADELISFALGRMVEHQMAQVAAHLTSCAECMAAVDRAVSDHFCQLLRSTDSTASRLPLMIHPGYEILEPIGQGGMGIVYKARQVGLGRIVALKRMRQSEFGDKEGLARFRSEATAMAPLAHPNIVQIYEVGEQDGSPFLACEFVQGRGLDQFLQGTPLPERSAARLLATLGHAIHVAHEHAIIHRDLKPSNVLLALPADLKAGPEREDFWQRVTPKIADFGLAKRLDAPNQQTQTNALLGTPEYMAPEQASGQTGLIGRATDVYALGVILYEALTGRRPFQGADIGETMRLVRETETIPLRRLRPAVPRDLEVICLKCLEKDPSRRYASAEAMASDLEAWLCGRPIAAKPPTSWERAAKWSRRNKAWAVAAMLAGILVVGSLVGGVVHVQSLRKEVARSSAAETKALEELRRGYEAIDKLMQTWIRDAPATPAWRARDLEMKEQVLAFMYKALAEANDKDPRVELSRGMLLTYAGSVQRTLGRFDLAKRDLELATEKLRPLVDDAALGEQARDHLCNCQFNLGATFLALNQPKEAGELLEQSLDHLLSVAPYTDEALICSRIALRHESLAHAWWALAQFEKAAESFTEVVEQRRRLVELRPDDVFNRSRLANACRNHVFFVPLRISIEQAEERMMEAEKVLSLPEGANSLLIARAKAELYAGWAILESKRGDNERLFYYHNEGIAWATRALAIEPTDTEARGDLFSLHRAKAYTLCRLNRFPESRPHWEEAIACALPHDRSFCRIELALELAIVGDYREAVQKAEEMLAEPEPQARIWFHGARVYSQALGAIGNDEWIEEDEYDRLVAEYAQRGVECLKRAASEMPKKQFSLSDIDIDPIFAPLRNTDPFRAWRSAQ